MRKNTMNEHELTMLIRKTFEDAFNAESEASSAHSMRHPA